MRSTYFLSVIVALAITTGCTDSGNPASIDDVTLSTATVVEEGPQFFVVRLDAPMEYVPVTTFYPVNLPEAFKKHMMRVRLIGRIETDPTAMYIHIPLRLTFIEQMRR